MTTLVNRAKMTTATTGTGTITLGSAEAGYQTFAAAGVSDGDVVRYVIEDGNNWEIGTGTYTASGTTLSRTPSESSNAGSAINLSGSAVVYVAATAADMVAQHTRDVFTATGGQTSFTTSVGYRPNNLDVFLNGVLLVNGTDYTATDGSSVVLSSGATVGDTVTIIIYSNVSVVPLAVQTRQAFTATSGQTTFSTSGYTQNYVDVYLNGVLLIDGTDYTATDGTDIVLGSGATTGDNLLVIATNPTTEIAAPKGFAIAMAIVFGG